MDLRSGAVGVVGGGNEEEEKNEEVRLVRVPDVR